jgi:hypothetical protein
MAMRGRVATGYNGVHAEREFSMKHTHQGSAWRALRSLPPGAFLRTNPTTDEMELVDRDGRPLAAEQQRCFFAQLPEVTLATLQASLRHCA